MMVLALGDNFRILLAILLVRVEGYIPFLLIFLMTSLAMKWCFCHGSWASRLRFFLCARIINNKKSLLTYKFIEPKIISHVNIVLSNSPREFTQTSELMDVHQCDKVDFPYLLFFLSAFFTIFFHSFSIVAFASGINIAWSERSFIHTFRFPEASVSERQVSSIVWTIRNSRFHNIYVLFVCTLPALVHTRDSLSRTTSGVCTSFCPGSLLRFLVLPKLSGYSKSFVPQIRHVPRRDSMR